MAELETERSLGEANREPAECFEQKLQINLSKIWGDKTRSRVSCLRLTSARQGRVSRFPIEARQAGRARLRYTSAFTWFRRDKLSYVTGLKELTPRRLQSKAS